ncbi:hypothetical protein HKX48_005205 [Thoreauomyces humboldtii]|nr:hypothetical protein HKX48_005205 [Thoreauomyces humboldtii]
MVSPTVEKAGIDLADHLLNLISGTAGISKVKGDSIGELHHASQARDEDLVAIEIDGQTGLLPDGTPASSEDQANLVVWKDLFERCGRSLIKFHSFRNSKLEARFEAARVKLKELGRPFDDERLLFHGTREANFDSILKNGLHVGGTCGTDIGIGCQSGVGIYLVNEAQGALGYTNGSTRIFGCRVLPGKSTDNVERVRKIPDIVLGNEKYDSWVGPYGKMDLYVVRCPDLVLPCYMLEFETPVEKPRVNYAPATARAKGKVPPKTSETTAQAVAKNTAPRKKAAADSRTVGAGRRGRRVNGCQQQHRGRRF